MEIIIIRKLKSIILLAMLIPLTVPAGIVCAETRYISDMLLVSLREGQGTGDKIKTLRTDTPVEVLEESGRYLKVRTEDGKEGWLPAQYLTCKTPKPVIISSLKEEISRLEARVKYFEKSLNESREDASKTTKELRLVTNKYNALLKRSKDVAKLSEDNERLQATNHRPNKETKELQQENGHLRNTEKLQWFLIGGTVFFMGWIAGKLSRKKKYFSS